MGRAKNQMMEEEAQGFANPPEWDVCAELFPRHKMIREFIQNHGHLGVCHYSGKHTKVVSLKCLLELINCEFRKYYEDPAEECGYSSSIKDQDFEGTNWHNDNGYILPNCRSVRDIDDVFEEESFWSDSEELDQLIKSSIFGYSWVECDPYGETPSEEMIYQWETFCSDTICSIQSGTDYQNTYSVFSERLIDIVSSQPLKSI